MLAKYEGKMKRMLRLRGNEHSQPIIAQGIAEVVRGWVEG